MTRNTTKSAAAERIYKLAMAARAVQRIKNGGCCGRKPSSKRKRRAFKRSSLNKEASRDLMRKIACAVAVIQRTRGLQKTAGDTPIYKNPIAIGTAGGGLIGGTLGAILGPKGQKFLSGLAGAGIGAAAGAGAGYGYTKLKKKPEEEKPEVEKKEEVVATPTATGQQGLVSTITSGFQRFNAQAKKWQKVKDRLVNSGISPDVAEKMIVSTPQYALEVAKNPSLYNVQVEVVDEDGNSAMQNPNGQYSILEN